MKKFILLISVLIIAFSGYSQTTISGKTPVKDVNISTADYSNGIPQLVATAEFIEPSGNKLLDAEETAQIKVSITNKGTNSAFDVGINVTVDNSQNLKFSISNSSLGDVEVGKTVTTYINLTADQYIQNTARKFNITFKEYQGFIAAPINYEIQTQKILEPKLVFVEAGIEEQVGNKNNIIELGELVIATILIQNKGQGTAVNSGYEIIGFDANLISVMTNNYPVSGNLGNLAAGESKSFKIAFSPSYNYTGSNTLPLKVKLIENRGTYGGTYDLGLQMNVQQLSAVDMKQPGEYQQIVDIKDVSLTSDIDKNIPVNPKNQNRFALIIGNEHYVSNGGLSADVPYAINDAVTFKEYATKTLGVPDNQVIFLTDARTTEMKNEIENFVGLMAINGSSKEFYIYYAGHGFYDANSDPYLMPVDIKHTAVKDAIKLSDFYNNLAQYQTKKTTVFLDACFSGGGRGDDGLVEGRTGIRRTTNNSNVAGNIVVFAASQGDQASKPYEEEKHGMFTYFLLKKIQDTKGDVIYDDLASYLEENVRTTSRLKYKEEQTPSVKVSPKIQEEWKNWSIK